MKKTEIAHGIRLMVQNSGELRFRSCFQQKKLWKPGSDNLLANVNKGNDLLSFKINKVGNINLLKVLIGCD